MIKTRKLFLKLKDLKYEKYLFVRLHILYIMVKHAFILFPVLETVNIIMHLKRDSIPQASKTKRTCSKKLKTIGFCMCMNQWKPACERVQVRQPKHWEYASVIYIRWQSTKGTSTVSENIHSSCRNAQFFMRHTEPYSIFDWRLIVMHLLNHAALQIRHCICSNWFNVKSFEFQEYQWRCSLSLSL